MNEQLRQRAQEIADEHGNDAYSVALAMLERENKIKAKAFISGFETSGEGWNGEHGTDEQEIKSICEKWMENQND